MVWNPLSSSSHSVFRRTPSPISSNLSYPTPQRSHLRIPRDRRWKTWNRPNIFHVSFTICDRCHPFWGGGLGRQARVAGLESLQLSSCCLILSLVYLLKEGSRVASPGDGVSVPSLTPEAPYPAPELFIQVTPAPKRRSL